MKRLYLIAALLFLSAVASGAQTSQATCTQAVASATTLISGITTLSYIDTLVLDNSVYGYVVTANTPFGFSCSNIITNITIPSTGTHSVTLTWQASTTPSVTYSVFRATPPSAVTITATQN